MDAAAPVRNVDDAGADGWRCGESGVDIDEPLLVAVPVPKTDHPAAFGRGRRSDDDPVASHRRRAVRLRPERDLPALLAGNDRQCVNPVSVTCDLGDGVDRNVQPFIGEGGGTRRPCLGEFGSPYRFGVYRPVGDLTAMAGISPDHRPRAIDPIELSRGLAGCETAGQAKAGGASQCEILTARGGHARAFEELSKESPGSKIARPTPIRGRS